MAGKSRNEMIIERAKRLFTQHGFHKTSIMDIADALNLTKSSIYHYFNSKDELFKEVIRNEGRELFSRLRNITNNIGSVEQQLKKTVTTYLKEWLSFPLLKDLFTHSHQRRVNVAAELRQEIFEDEVSLIEEIFSKGQSEGCFSIARPKILAQTVIAAIHGIEISSELQDTQITPEEYVEEFVQVLLRGITNKDVFRVYA